MNNLNSRAMIARRTLLAGSTVSFLLSTKAVATITTPRNAALGTVVDTFVREQSFQGLVILSKAGCTTYSRCAGMADLARQIPIRETTPFAIASISKRLTAVAILRLVEQGKLMLDGPITTWLPWYRKDTGARITLRHLLSNSSGVVNQFLVAQKADPTFVAPDLSTQDAIVRFASGDLAFEPGTRFDYSACNWYIVLGVIEAVTGLPYPQAMKQLVLDPLQLHATTLEPAADTAKSYRKLAPPEEWSSLRRAYQAAAGGYFSTADDLLRFARSVYEDSFLSPVSRNALTTIEVASDAYALGGRVRAVEIDGRTIRAAWETGNTAGYRSVLGHRLDGKGAVVILNNTAMSQKTMDEFAESLLRQSHSL